MVDVLQELCQMGAIKYGHFVLSSGMHSNAYVQCARVGEYPDKVHTFCSMLVDSFDQVLKNNITCVASPALGGIVFGYEIARVLGVRFVFCERVNGKMQLRRDFEIKESDNILIMEDVVTTGKSSLEVFECIKNAGGNVSAFASIVNRSGKEQIAEMPLFYLINFIAEAYDESNLPEGFAKIPVTIPGSRFSGA